VDLDWRQQGSATNDSRSIVNAHSTDYSEQKHNIPVESRITDMLGELMVRMDALSRDVAEPRTQTKSQRRKQSTDISSLFMDSPNVLQEI